MPDKIYFLLNKIRNSIIVRIELRQIKVPFYYSKHKFQTHQPLFYPYPIEEVKE